MRLTTSWPCGPVPADLSNLWFWPLEDGSPPRALLFQKLKKNPATNNSSQNAGNDIRKELPHRRILLCGRTGPCQASIKTTREKQEGKDAVLAFPPAAPCLLPTRSAGEALSAWIGKYLKLLVGAKGFEPSTPCSQSRCATKLRHAPTKRPAPWLVGAGKSAGAKDGT